jgi:hypothetical protein
MWGSLQSPRRTVFSVLDELPRHHNRACGLPHLQTLSVSDRPGLRLYPFTLFELSCESYGHPSYHRNLSHSGILFPLIIAPPHAYLLHRHLILPCPRHSRLHLIICALRVNVNLPGPSISFTLFCRRHTRFQWFTLSILRFGLPSLPLFSVLRQLHVLLTSVFHLCRHGLVVGLFFSFVGLDAWNSDHFTIMIPRGSFVLKEGGV